MIKTLRPRLPRLGIIRLGEKRMSKSGRELPVNSPFFVFPKPGEPSHELLAGRFDSQTNVLDVHFPIDDIDEVCRDYYRLYTAQGLQCWGDGESGTFLFQEERTDARGEPYTFQERRERPCASRRCPQAAARACRPSALLSFCLSEVPALGVWQMPTRSLTAIRLFRTILGLAKETFDTIVSIPFPLYRYPIHVAPEGRRKQVMVAGLRIHPLALLQPVAGTNSR